MHINYHRGETREYVYRRDSKRVWGSRRTLRGRKGLGKRYLALGGLGRFYWCPCCVVLSLRRRGRGKNHSTARLVHRLARIEGRRQCREGLEEWEIG